MYPIEDGDGLGTSYDWNLWTAPQTYLDGAERPYDMGRGVGGGSLINGMCWTRGGKADYDAWVTLGNPGWGWDDLLPYFKKSENYTDNVDSHFSRELYIKPSPSTHGSDGYVHVSYPRYFYNQSQLFLDGLRELGIPILTDPNNGTAAGGMLIPDSINPDNQTRSYARLDYFDTVINTRQNLHVATHQHVTRVLIDGPHNVRSRNYPAGLWVSGVEFLTDGSLAFHNVSCSREVILSAGAVHTPQILESSGIGDPALLSKFGIPVIINLPGVGNNFQDHPYVGVVYYYGNSSYFNIDMLYNNPQLFTQLEQEYYVNKTGPWTAGAINTVAFPSLPSISLNWTNMMYDAANQSTSQHLLSGLDSTIIAGYEAQKAILVNFLSRPDVGAYEILNDNIGLLSVATMHPFSRGSVHIQSTNPFLQPLIDPRYCSNSLDCQVLVEALLFNNQLIDTKSMRLLEPGPYAPFLPNATAENLMPAIQTGLRTEFHGTGTTSMLPLNLGGVVDTHLRVYGTKNLRVVDAGIIPLVPAAHLQAPVYAIAEKAADIIKSDNLGLASQGCSSNSASAQQDPIITNSSNRTSSLNVSSYSRTSSSPIFQPTESNFPELLNASALVAFEPSSKLNSTSTRPPFALGGAQDQLPSTAPQFVTGDEILDAISIFLTSRSAPTSIAGQTISISSTNSIQGPSFLSPVSSSSTKSTTITTNNAAEVVIRAENNSVSTELTPRKPALIHGYRPSGAAGNIISGFQSSPSRSRQTSTSLPWNYMVQNSGNVRSSEIQASSDPVTSKHVQHTSRHDTKIAYTSSSKTDDRKTTTYTSTVTRLVTITMPQAG